MKRINIVLSLLMVLGLTLAAMPTSSQAADLAALPAPVQKIYDRTDKGVVDAKPGAFWVWGPRVQDNEEDYKESPNGKRKVYYFEKGRLEISDPAKDPNDKYYVTSGLLLRELITGRVQLGDNTFQDREPANQVLAGDFAPTVSDSPTYASLANLVSFDGSWKSDDVTGQPVNKVLAKGGRIYTKGDLGAQATYGQYYKETGHNVAKPFVDFMNKQGTIYDGQYKDKQPIFDPIYVFGYPISEPYWSHISLGGKEAFVLVQAFERRLLTYNPANADPYKVELGNLGIAYTQWRYKTAPAAPAATDPDYARPTATDAFNLYNSVNSNMQSLNTLRNKVTRNNAAYSTQEFQAPDRYRQVRPTTYRGRPATEETIFIGRRTFLRLSGDGFDSGWFYADSDPAWSWPKNYSPFNNLDLNNWSSDWQLSDVIKLDDKTNARNLGVSGTDLDGSKVTRNRLVIPDANLIIGRSTLAEYPDGTKSLVANSYYDFNAKFSIDPPSNAKPLAVAHTEGVDFESAASRNAEIDPLANRLAKTSDRILVKFKPSYRTQATSLAEKYSSFGLSLSGNWQEMNNAGLPVAFKVDPTNLEQVLAELQANPAVEFAQAEEYRHTFVTQFNDPNAGDQYYLKAIRAPRGWDYTTGDKAISVAVIDTGADLGNPDLKDNIGSTYNSEKDNTNASDIDGHGSWTDGIVGAVGNNGVFGSGLVWNANLLVIRADKDDDPGSFSDAAIIQGLKYATDKGVKVINMSLGGFGKPDAVCAGVKYATDKGVVVIAAAGNESTNQLSYPASCPGVISVAATGLLGQPAYFSNYGSKVTIAAPGVRICNTVLTGKFGCADGTSASSPIIAGAATMILSVNPTLTADQVKAILYGSAQPAPGKTQGQRDDRYGYGTLDLGIALRMAATNQIPALPADLPK